MRRLLGWICGLWAVCAVADGERGGDFDYYVLALSWQPSFCATSDSSVCAEPRGWALHGLWPQYEQGYPVDCVTDRRDPSRSETAAMADVYGAGGLAWYQWKRHGRCSGLDPADYFRLVRLSLERVERPDIFARIEQVLRVAPQVVEDAWSEANPGLTDPMMRVTCKDGRIQELRICLTRELDPRACSYDAARDCSLDGALLPPIR